MGREEYRREVADGEGDAYLLNPPAVVVHITATPIPTWLSLISHGQDILPGRMFALKDGPDYVGVDAYRWLCEPGTNNPVHLDDGDLCPSNCYSNWKVNLWLDDLDSVPFGFGLFIGNSRGDPGDSLLNLLGQVCQLDVTFWFCRSQQCGAAVLCRDLP